MLSKIFETSLVTELAQLQKEAEKVTESEKKAYFSFLLSSLFFPLPLFVSFIYFLKSLKRKRLCADLASLNEEDQICALNEIGKNENDVVNLFTLNDEDIEKLEQFYAKKKREEH